MDLLHFGSITFPVRSGELWRDRKNTTTDYAWGIEIHCDESSQLAVQAWLGDRAERPLDWLAGVEPYLYAQMLPLCAASPDELVGREYAFPQSPNDATPDWPGNIGWPFFCLYLHEHHC